ncbi:keratin, ultra high-sulfur matrix protein-like [Heteronotia binoei]|uniref:keratin, ultra high-sulfur matrix protein-like n=1 Tax=Heteronotia binoei TaxID=13085 RepID=UPI00292E6E65|nr:keratin, ultra high-sulfur matrix protein-like [Heteronotia binoei]
MPEERIYSSGREPYFNLNSTWYGPAGSWLDTRRKPFHYAHNTCCITGCNRRDDIPRRGGHDYRCYGYRRSTCRSGGNPRVRCCVHNPSGGPRDYWGRPIGDSCNGNTGGYYSNEESFSAEGCCGSSGGCGSGGTGACSQPCFTSVGCGTGGAGVCSEPGGCGTGGKGVCSELGGCGTGGKGVCFEPGVCSTGGKGVYSEPGGRGTGGKGVCSELGGYGTGGKAVVKQEMNDQIAIIKRTSSSPLKPMEERCVDGNPQSKTLDNFPLQQSAFKGSQVDDV